MKTPKWTELVCGNCDKPFDIATREYKRQTKRGRIRFFCSLRCAAVKNNEEHPKTGKPEHLVGYVRQPDKYSQFKWVVRIAKSRAVERNYGCDITVEYLFELFHSQNGICPFTGWTLILPPAGSGFKSSNPANASLDRIDNSKGYIQGNVRFIAFMANIGRGIFTDEQLIEFCKAVAGNRHQ